MMATLDLAAVSRFTADLNERQRRCDNGEGMECSTLENSINHYVQLCEELQNGVVRWAHAVFSGEVPLDPAVETLLVQETRILIGHAKRVAERGRTFEGPCFVIEGLDRLYRRIQFLEGLLSHWVTPQLAVGPASRTTLPEETQRQITERLAKLQPLPSDWRPADREQAAFFRKQMDEC
jgi:hypothetical protein